MRTWWAMSLPVNWSNSVPVTSDAQAVDGTYWAVPHDEEPFEALPAAPGGVAAIVAAGAHAGPRYGVKPVVMPKQGIF